MTGTDAKKLTDYRLKAVSDFKLEIEKEMARARITLAGAIELGDNETASRENTYCILLNHVLDYQKEKIAFLESRR